MRLHTLKKGKAITLTPYEDSYCILFSIAELKYIGTALHSLLDSMEEGTLEYSSIENIYEVIHARYHREIH